MNFFGIGKADNIREFLEKKIICTSVIINAHPKDKHMYECYLDAYRQTLEAVILFDKEKI